MKLHLPKQLFTALLAAITLAASPVAKGKDAFTNIDFTGSFYAKTYEFSFMLNEGATSGTVVGAYWGGSSNDPYGANALTITNVVANADGTYTYTLELGRGGLNNTNIDSLTAFTPKTEAIDAITFTGTFQSGVVYTISGFDNGTTGDKHASASITQIASGFVVGATDGEYYKNNMNGSGSKNNGVNSAYSVAGGDLVWCGSGDAADLAASSETDGVATLSNWKTAGLSGTASTLEGANLIFDASSSVAKEVGITNGVTAGSIALYDNYTFNATGATSLTVTNGITIAQGKSLTLQGSAITLTGAFSNNGTLNIGGTLALTSSNQLGTLGATTVKSGGVLDLSGLNGGVLTVDLFNAVNSSNSLTVEDEAWVKLGGANLSADFVTANKTEDLNKNLHITGDIRFNGKGYNAGSSYKLVVGEGKQLKVDGITKLESKAYLSVQGGDVELGTLLLGHDQGGNPGGLEMSSGSLTLNKIKFNDNNQSNQQATVNTVQITGGALEFTSESALDRGINVSSTISIGGAGEDSVTLKATKTAWTLDGSGLTAAPTIGNVTVDASNAYGITLKNVNLAGSIVNNAELTLGIGVTLAGDIVNNAELALGNGVTVAADGSATVTGGKVQILSTLASAGTLNLNTDAIYVNETLLGYKTSQDNFECSLDGTNIDEGGVNGFRFSTSTSYYLSEDANVTTTLNKVWRDENTSYELKSDESGLYFLVATENPTRTSTYYITSGDVTVDSTVQALATSYSVEGGNMKITEGSVSGAAITYTSGSITLNSDATLTNLTAKSDGALMGSVTGSGTMEVAVADNWNDTITTSADFTGTVYVVGGAKFTYDSDKLGSTLKLATGVNMQVQNGGRLDDTLVLESGNHEVHVNGTNTFNVTGTISGEGTFDKRGGDSTVYIKDNASVGNYRNGVGTTTVQGNASVANLTAAGGSVNVQGGAVTTLNANGGTSSLTGGNVTNLKIAGGTVNVQGGALSNVNYNGTGGTLTFEQVGSQATTYTLSTIETSHNDNYTRHLTVNSGVTVKAENLLNTWGMGTITVDGALNISEELKFSTGENNSKENNKLTGSGSVTTKKLTIGNVGKYNFSNVNLTVGAGGVTMTAATLEVTSGTMTFDGQWNGTGGTVNLMGGDIFLNYASGDNVMNILDIAGDNASTAQVSLAQDVKLQVNSNMWLGGTAAIKLAKDAELKKGNMAIIGTGNESTVTRLTSGDDNTFSHGSDDHAVTNARVDMSSGSAAALALKLDNTAVTNTGAGELTVSNSGNSITNLAAKGGNVAVSESMGIDSISAANGKVVSVAAGKTVTMGGGTTISTTDSSAAATMTAKSDSALMQMQQDASFTIADMTLTNTTITAATVDTKVELSNVSVGADSLVTLAKGAFTVQDQANVAMGGSACEFTTSSYSGFTLGSTADAASITLNLGDLSQLNPMGPGVYDITILLEGFQMTGDNASVLFAADSWLGKLLAQSNNANVEISISQVDAGEAAAAGAATGVSYSTGNVGTIITINGLNVPEPTTSTLSLLALAGLCARRRRKND